MVNDGARIRAERIVVVMPNWLGDGVMATPFLRGLRELYPAAFIGAVARPLVGPVLSGLGGNAEFGIQNAELARGRGLVDELFVARRGEEAAARGWVRKGNFDLGVLLPNSFRSAWLLWRGGVKRRLGYARGGRSWLLSDRVMPLGRSAERRTLDRQRENAIRRIGRQRGDPVAVRVGSGYEPVPTIDYYLELLRFLRGEELPPASRGLYEGDRRMVLAVTAEEADEGDRALALAGIGAEDVIVTMVPGANFGSSKCWLPERFAQVADRLMDRPERGGHFGAHVVLAGAPAEMPIVQAILAASALCPKGEGIGRLHATANMNGRSGLSLGALKHVVRRSRLMICNDTGPRHFAAAFGVPTVTLFGPTDPVWAETYWARERIVRIEVPCGPCQLKKCPIDHRCMRGIEVEMVMAAVRELWGGQEERVEEPDVDPRELA